MDEKGIKEMLEENFKNKKTNNASERTMSEILKIAEICEKCEDLIVYMKRNKKNENYFIKIEKESKEKGMISKEKIEWILFNKDNYIYFREGRYDKRTMIMQIRKNLLEENNCAICLNNENILNIPCEQCCSYICKKCLIQMTKIECPICRTDMKKYIKGVSLGDDKPEQPPEKWENFTDLNFLKLDLK